MIINILSVYIVGSLQGNQKIPKDLKHYTYDQKKEDHKSKGMQDYQNGEKDTSKLPLYTSKLC